jgi:hypothetical protein
MKKIVLCFGSFGAEGDDIAFKICERLEGKMSGVIFKKCISPMDILDFAEKGNLFILDAVRGLDNVMVFESTDEFRKVKSLTAHDLDLGTVMKVLKGAGKIRDIKIIGIPASSDHIKAAKEVERILSS